MTHTFDTLRSTVSGEVLVPGDEGYETSSTVMTATGSPALVVRPRSADDVAAAVVYATRHSLAISVRNGGHSMSGHGTNDGGMVIDMMHLATVEVLDAAAHTVRIGGGAQWGAVAKELEQHGLGISSGDTASVGVAGLTLAGGVGWMVRKYGLALDNLRTVELVLADGSIVRASQDEHADLFWGVRGGGGNFGIATSFEFTAHPVSEVYFGAATFAIANLKEVLTGWRDLMRTATEDLTTMLTVMPANPAFGNTASVMVDFCFDGDDQAAADAAINPFLELAPVLSKDITRMPYSKVLQEVHPPKGVSVVVNNAIIRELSDEVIATIVDNPGPILQIRSLGGAMHRVPATATAFAHRDSEVMVVCPTFVAPDASDDDRTQALRTWHTIAAFSVGAYINFFTVDDDHALTAAYPADTLARLRKLKATYDPQNVFHRNYNIAPPATV